MVALSQYFGHYQNPSMDVLSVLPDFDDLSRGTEKIRARLSVCCANTTLKQSPADPAAVQTHRFQEQKSLKAGRLALPAPFSLDSRSPAPRQSNRIIWTAKSLTGRDSLL
jgi:hypothetical protein